MYAIEVYVLYGVLCTERERECEYEHEGPYMQSITNISIIYVGGATVIVVIIITESVYRRRI